MVSKQVKTQKSFSYIKQKQQNLEKQYFFFVDLLKKVPKNYNDLLGIKKRSSRLRITAKDLVLLLFLS